MATYSHENRASVSPIGWRPQLKFGDRMRAVRRSYQDQLGEPVSQAQMADLIGVGRKAYSAWESNLHEPGELWQVCLAVASATGCDPVWLADLDGPTSGPKGGAEQAVQPSRCISHDPPLNLASVLRFAA